MAKREAEEGAEPAPTDLQSKLQELEALSAQNRALETLLSSERGASQVIRSQVESMEVRNRARQESVARREVELVALQDAYGKAASGLAKEMLDLQAREKRLLERSSDLRPSLEREVMMQLSPERTKMEREAERQEKENCLYLRLVALEEKLARVHRMESTVASERQELDLKLARLSEKEAVLAYRASVLDAGMRRELGHDEEAPIQGAWSLLG
jgi:chromosome segregation ATPase